MAKLHVVTLLGMADLNQQEKPSGHVMNFKNALGRRFHNLEKNIVILDGTIVKQFVIDMRICAIEGSRPRSQSNDPYVDFRNYTSFEDAKWRSWQSIPCALKTEFFPYNGTNFHECYKYDAFIVLFNDDPEYLIPFVKKLKLMGKKVAVGYHESFDDLMLRCSHDFDWLKNAKNLVKESDFYLNVCPSFKRDVELLFEKESVHTYHAAPFGKYDSFKKKFQDRSGVLITTRSFNQRLRRNTLWSIIQVNEYCKKNNTNFTFVCEDRISRLPAFDRMVAMAGPLSYNDWIELISRHRFVYGMDEAKTLGQVNLDAALVGVVGFGGNSENNKLTNSCNDIFEIDYDRDYQGQISTLENLCSMDSVGLNIQRAFQK